MNGVRTAERGLHQRSDVGTAHVKSHGDIVGGDIEGLRRRGVGRNGKRTLRRRKSDTVDDDGRNIIRGGAEQSAPYEFGIKHR